VAVTMSIEVETLLEVLWLRAGDDVALPERLGT
jgi:hypothetical protein